jgi:hypothetical protein
MSTICMKIDPGMHIGLHLVFFGKSGVTAEVRIIVSAQSVIPFQPSRLRSFPTRRQELNTHTRAVQGPLFDRLYFWDDPFGHEGVR